MNHANGEDSASNLPEWSESSLSSLASSMNGGSGSSDPSLTSQTTRVYSHLEEVDFIGKLADLKEEHYRQSLLLDAIIDLLEEHQLLTREEILARSAALHQSQG